ncbi:hypothetical protein D9M72_400450 [compost metagenome]
MRNGHGRGSYGRLTVDLGAVLGGEGLVGAAEELAGNRETAVALALGDAGGLQQMQCTAAGTDEHELRVDVAVLSGLLVLERQVPAATRSAPDAVDVVSVVDLHAVVAKVRGQLTGQCAEVDVGSFGRARGRNPLLRVTALDDQGRPLGNLCVVFGVLHGTEEGVRLQCLIPGLQEVRVGVPDDETHVGDSVDEPFGGADERVADQVGPELAG